MSTFNPGGPLNLSRTESNTSDDSDQSQPSPPPHPGLQQQQPHAGQQLSPPQGGEVGASGGWSADAVKVEEGDEDDNQTSSKTGKVKRKRNRKPSSCAACRKKKLRCNRAAPCNQCTARGEECIWDDATPLFNARAELDAEELRQQVAKLEGLVRYLTSQPADLSPVPSYLMSPGASYFSGHSRAESGIATDSVSHFSSTRPGDSPSSPRSSYINFPSQSAPSVASMDREHAQPKHDLRANDLCEALSQIAIKDFVVVEGSGTDAVVPGGGKGETWIKEAEEFMRTMPQRFGVTKAMPFEANESSLMAGFRGADSSGAAEKEKARLPSPSLSPSPFSTSSFHRAAPPLADILKFLPTHKQALSAYTYFCGYVSWYSHPVHLATFEQQWKELQHALTLPPKERDEQLDPFFIATYLGVLAMGLAMMPEKRAARDGFPEDKDAVVDFWLEGAMAALTCGRFLDNPSVEAVRAVVIISTYFVFMAPGESSGAGMGLLALGAQVAMSLGLHRDPDRTPSKFTFFEAEERRRLFWNLFMLCMLSSSSLGRTWAVFDLNGVDTKLPYDCHDHEIIDEAAANAGIEARTRKSEETPLTSLISKMKLAVVAKKMNDRAFSIHPVTYSTVLELDRELKEFEESVPAQYRLYLDSVGALKRATPHITVTEMRACMIQVSVASEFIRLHRPWLVMAGTNKQYQHSRDQTLKYCKLLLAIYRSPSCSKKPWGGMTYKATNAATCLAVEILSFPHGSESAVLRSIVRSTLTQMESFAKTSSLCRKGSRIIRFLLEKDALLTTQRDQQRDHKRARTSFSAGGQRFGPRLVGAFDSSSMSASPMPASPQVSADSDDLRRKTPSYPATIDPSTLGWPETVLPPSITSSAYQRPIAPTPQPRHPVVPEMPDYSSSNFLDFSSGFNFDFQLPVSTPLQQPYSYSPYANILPSYDSPASYDPATTMAQLPPTPASYLGTPAVPISGFSPPLDMKTPQYSKADITSVLYDHQQQQQYF